MAAAAEQRKISAEIDQLHRRLELLVATLNAEIEALPDNPRIKRLSPNAFVINSKDLGDDWTVIHHDFKAQYREVVKALQAVKPVEAIDRLRQIIRERKIVISRSPGNRVNLHDDVVAHLQTILERS